MAVEKASYTVVDKRGDVELRAYDEAVVAQTVVSADQKSAGNKAFRRLAGYIFGGNASDRTFAMTAPVIQQPVDSGYRVAFFMPRGTALEDMPLPADDSVELTILPASLFAAIRYRGGWSVDRYEKHLRRLRDQLGQEKDLAIVGDPVWARYDAPFMPSPFRTNEILLPVERLQP